MLKIQELSENNFNKYGTYLNPLEKPASLGEDAELVQFYPDRMLQTFAASNFMALSPLIIKPRKLEIVDVEKHNYTEEVIGGFTEDVCFHVSPATDGAPDLSEIEVFCLPAGWWVRFKRGVWHKAPFVLADKSTYGLVLLPPHTFTNDCENVNLPSPRTIKKER